MALESAYDPRLKMMVKVRQQISIEKDSVIEAPTLSDVFEEILKPNGFITADQ